MRRVSVFGATGSIGVNTLDLLRRQGGAKAYRFVALTGGRNIRLLAEQAREMRPEITVTAHDDCLDELKRALEGTGLAVAAGPAALAEAADRPADWVMSAITGVAGLEPGLVSLRHGGVLALANKESMVAAGPLMRAEAARHGATILPVDSEHSALFQALAGEDRGAVRELILTASGGPFRDWPLERLHQATPEQALAHPNWEMGDMISVDSASMFNKALEMIEARELFQVAPEQVRVVVHPQSIIHSLAAFVDGSVIAHMGVPDMRFAIGYALNWPARRPLPVDPLDLAALGRLDFAAPDETRFPALALARRVMAAGGLAGALFNAAKEAAYHAFMQRRIRFTAMAEVVARVLDKADAADDLQTGPEKAAITLDHVVEADRWARAAAGEVIAALD